MNYNTSGQVPAAVVDNSGTLKKVVTILGPFPGGILAINGTVSADPVHTAGGTGNGPLTHLQASVKANNKGSAVAVAADTDFNSASADPWVKRCTTNPHTTAVGSAFAMVLNVDGVEAVEIDAASANGCLLQIDYAFPNLQPAGTAYTPNGFQ